MSLPEYRLVPSNYQVERYLVRRDGEEQFDLHAPYQRSSVWTDEQRRNLIKSMLMGLPIGAVLIADPANDVTDAFAAMYRVVDGKQRIETLRMFAAGELAVPIGWWRDNEVTRRDDEASKAVGWPMTTYDLLTQNGQRKFRSLQFPSLEFRSRDEWTFDIASRTWDCRARSDAQTLAAEAAVYLLINAAGTEHTPEDLARATAIVTGKAP